MSCKALPVHSEITSQTVEGVLESSRPIFLEEEVTDPRWTVPSNRDRGRDLPRLRHERVSQERQSVAGAQKVAQSADTVPVFAKVERIERAEGLEAIAAGHGEDRDRESTRLSLARSLARINTRQRERCPFSRSILCTIFGGVIRNQFINQSRNQKAVEKEKGRVGFGRGTNTKTREDAEHEHEVQRSALH